MSLNHQFAESMTFLLQPLWINLCSGRNESAATSASAMMLRLHHGLTPIRSPSPKGAGQGWFSAILVPSQMSAFDP